MCVCVRVCPDFENDQNIKYVCGGRNVGGGWLETRWGRAVGEVRWVKGGWRRSVGSGQSAVGEGRWAKGGE